MGGWDGAIWDDFSSWTCPFPVGDMDRPLPIGDMDWPLSLTYCPLVHPVMRFRARECDDSCVAFINKGVQRNFRRDINCGN